MNLNEFSSMNKRHEKLRVFSLLSPKEQSKSQKWMDAIRKRRKCFDKLDNSSFWAVQPRVGQSRVDEISSNSSQICHLFSLSEMNFEWSILKEERSAQGTVHPSENVKFIQIPKKERALKMRFGVRDELQTIVFQKRNEPSFDRKKRANKTVFD